jgi:hypothetical protein
MNIQMTVGILFPLLVLAASAATVAFAISYRARSRMPPASAIAAFSPSGGDLSFMDAPKQAVETSIQQIVPVQQSELTLATQAAEHQPVIADEHPAALPAPVQTCAITNVSEIQASPMTVEAISAQNATTSTLPRTRRTSRSHTSQGRRARKKTIQPQATQS